MQQGNFSNGPGLGVHADFFRKWVQPCLDAGYLEDRNRIIDQLNQRNEGNPDSRYQKRLGTAKIRPCWDGLINRCVELAAREDECFAYAAQSLRIVHIGFYGHNRPIRGFPWWCRLRSQRLTFLRRGLEDPAFFARMDAHYRDYAGFDPALANLAVKSSLGASQSSGRR